MHIGSTLIQLKYFKFEQRTKALNKTLLSLSENNKAKAVFDTLIVESGEENVTLKKAEHDVFSAHISFKNISSMSLDLGCDVCKGGRTGGYKGGCTGSFKCGCKGVKSHALHKIIKVFDLKVTYLN